MSEKFDCRNAFSETLVALAAKDPRIVAVCNDSVGSSKLGAFREAYPDRLVNVGIAEQNMVGVGAGLANAGKIPFVCAASCFLTGRSLEQVKADIAYSGVNVKLVGMSSGMAYGALGPTHHSIEDLAWSRAIANLPIYVPADPVETTWVTKKAVETEGPLFIRLSRMGVPVVTPEDSALEFGRATTLRGAEGEGAKATVMANGTLVHRALDAAEKLATEGIDVRVVNMSSLRPLDHKAIEAAARETGAIVVAEEATTNGGLGGAVAEAVVQSHPVPMSLVGVPGVFAPTGDTPYLFEHFGLTAEGIATAVRGVIARKAATTTAATTTGTNA